ncbi:MAG: glycosyltransferase family 87 protein [Gemmataceae bacterium]
MTDQLTALFDRPVVRRLFYGGLVVLLLVVAVRHAAKVGDERSAFLRWRSQLLHLDDGVDLSARFNYPNPPIMAVLLEPLAYLPPRVGAHLWFALELAMAAGSLWLLRALIERERPLPSWAWMLLVLCCLKPVVDELTHGNVNLLMVFLVVLTLVAYQRRRDLLAGLLLALAIACKVTPALFVPYLLWQRSWRALAGVALGLGLFLFPGVVPAARLGMADNLEQLGSWYQVMVRPYVAEGRVTSEYLNQSLPGVVARLLTEQPSLVFWQGNDPVPARLDNVLALSTTSARWLVKGCLVAYLLLMAGLCRRSTGPDRPAGRLTAEFALVVLGMLLFSERTWKHHAVTLMLVFAALVPYLATPATWQSRQRGWAMASLLTLALGLMLLSGMSAGADRRELAHSPGFAKLALIYGGYTWAFLLLLFATAARLLDRSAALPATTDLFRCATRPIKSRIEPPIPATL